jgi:adenine-specific DNA-methyltransferase
MARSPQSSKGKPPKQVDALKHNEASRRNIPTAEMESFFRRDEDSAPRPPKHYPRARPLAEGVRRTAEEPSQPELIWNGARITITDEQMAELAETGTLTLSDAQLVWRGKDRQDWSDLVVNVPPLYIQEKIHPKAIIDDLKRRSAEKREAQAETPDLFADFNGIEPDQRAEFYQHDQHWSNRMILGDSLQVMASLAERESLRSKVQCIYFDPPYGIKFNSNWQVSTQSRDVKDGKQTDISREPEQVKAFRDTWKDGIHSYLTYLRDRLTLMRDLLTESGSIFVQIGDEHVHRVRAVLDEVFGQENFVSLLVFKKTGGQSTTAIANVNDFIVWYAKDRSRVKARPLYAKKMPGEEGATNYEWIEEVSGARRPMTAGEKERVVALPPDCKIMQPYPMFSDGPSQRDRPLVWRGSEFKPSSNSHWKTHGEGLQRVSKADRFVSQGKTLRFVNYLTDYDVTPLLNIWGDVPASVETFLAALPALSR